MEGLVRTSYHVVLVNPQNGKPGGALSVINAGAVNAGDIRALLLVELDYRLEINVRNNIAVGHDNVFRAGLVNELGSACQSLKTSAVNTVVAPAVRGQDMQTTGLSCEVPLAAHAEVIHQGIILSLCDYAHLCYAGIHHA